MNVLYYNSSLSKTEGVKLINKHQFFELALHKISYIFVILVLSLKAI